MYETPKDYVLQMEIVGIPLNNNQATDFKTEPYFSISYLIISRVCLSLWIYPV